VATLKLPTLNIQYINQQFKRHDYTMYKLIEERTKNSRVASRIWKRQTKTWPPIIWIIGDPRFHTPDDYLKKIKAYAMRYKLPAKWTAANFRTLYGCWPNWRHFPEYTRP